jgi:hypothetical protein
MLHFSCDLCGKPLGKERYVARLEVYPAYDPEEIDEDLLDSDHLEELASLLAEVGDGEFEVEDVGPKEFRFDLCPNCHPRFVADPLGRERLTRLKYSEN